MSTCVLRLCGVNEYNFRVNKGASATEIEDECMTSIANVYETMSAGV